MVAATYQLSRKYLSRFFFRRVLEDVLEVDPNPPEVEARGLTYFLDHLTNQLKENEQPPATPEADELGDEYLKRGVVVGLLGRSRRLQATTAVEIEAQFILHGHWLLKHEQSIRMRAKRLFDLVKWQRGLRRLRRTTSAPVDDDSDDSTGIITVPRRAPRAQPDPVQVPSLPPLLAELVEKLIPDYFPRSISKPFPMLTSTMTPTNQSRPASRTPPLRLMAIQTQPTTPSCSISSRSGAPIMLLHQHGRTTGSGTALSEDASTLFIPHTYHRKIGTS